MPLMLDLTNKKLLLSVVGKLLRRIKTLLNYTEHIHVVSPAITNQIAQWVETQRITYLEKRFEPTDIEEADMVIAATNHSEVNEEVRLSVPEHVLFNHAEQAELGNVTFPNVFEGSLND